MAASYKNRNNGQSLNIFGGYQGGSHSIQSSLGREDVIRKVDQDRVLLANMRSEVRVDNLRYRRSQQQKRNEEAMAQSIQAEKDKREQKRKQQEIDEKITKRLEEEHNIQIREAKMRQHIRENSPELRQLELKLKAAYMNRERVAQVNEMRTKNERERHQEMQFVKARDAELREQNYAAEKKQQEIAERALETRRELETQLEERERQKQQDYQEFLKEKLMIDDIVKQIHLEDEAIHRERRMQQDETRKYISEFEKSRSLWKQQAKEEAQRQEKEIMEFAEKRRERDEARAAMKNKEKAEHDIVYTKLATKIKEESDRKRELQRLRDELYFEEQNHQLRLDNEQKARKKIEMRQTMQAYQAEQLEIRAEAMRKAKEEEEAFRRRLMEKFQHDERILELKEHERKQKQIEFKGVVDRLMEERKEIARAQLRKEEEDAEKQKKEEMYRQQLYEEEKRRLIQEHGANLVDFLPKGVLRYEDLDLLSEDDRKRLLNGKESPKESEKKNSNQRTTLSLREL